MTAEGFVLDASIAVAWAFEDEDDSRADAFADRLVSSFALVPSLWHIELANALSIGIRRGRIDAAAVTMFQDLLGQLDIRTDVAPPDAGRLAAAAVDHALTAYDCAYLLLAVDRGLPMATNDRGLAAAARAAGVTVL